MRDLVERHPIGDRAAWLAMRRQDVTASAVGALLGVHDYVTPYALWALKTGRIEDDATESAAIARGRRLEPIVIDMVREERPDWLVKAPAGEYLRDSVIRLGATPDAYVNDPLRGFGTLQVKTTHEMIFRDKWRGEAGEIEPPLWIAAQTLVEAHLAGARWAAVAVLVVGFGLDLHIVDVPLHAGLIERLRSEVGAFWRMVDSGTPPDPDYGRDAATIARLFAEDDGETIDLSGDNRILAVLDERACLKAREADGAAAEKARKPLDAEILAKLGSAARGTLADGRVIEAKTIRRSAYAVKASSYRTIKVRGEAA